MRRFICATFAALVTVPLLATPAQADLFDDATPIDQTQSDANDPYAGVDWNDYTVVGLPEYVLGPASFEVQVNGNQPICRMAFADQVDTTAPWQFNVPNAQALGRGGEIAITLCDGTEDTAYITSQAAVRVGQSVLVAAKKPVPLSIRNYMDTPVSIRVDLDGKPVVEQPVAAFDSIDVRVPTSSATYNSTATVTITAADGRSESSTIPIAKGWSLMLNGGSLASARTHPVCSVVTWSYDPKGEPKGGSTFKKDIAPALSRLSKETGLKFQEVPVGADAQLRYTWHRFGGSTLGGVGGTNGLVQFNTTSFWVKNSYAGFGPGRPPGRGWLIIHETMHTLGFGHTSTKSSVMAPTNYGVHKFNKGDLVGLHTLYPSGGCS